MKRMKLFVGIIVFGSMWGFAECIIGPIFDSFGLPSGALMTGFFAIVLMMMSRILFKQRGMQIGMGLVAGILRFFNPFGGCVICSSIAIASEGLLFEIIWYGVSIDLKEINTNTMKISMGILSGYICYIGGYIITQILTPIVSSTGFYLENLISFIPQIFSRGLPAAFIGGAIVPTLFILKKVDIYKITDRIYYPSTASITIICWLIVILNSFLFINS